MDDSANNDVQKPRLIFEEMVEFIHDVLTGRVSQRQQVVFSAETNQTSFPKL